MLPRQLIFSIAFVKINACVATKPKKKFIHLKAKWSTIFMKKAFVLNLTGKRSKCLTVIFVRIVQHLKKMKNAILAEEKAA